MNEDLSSSSMAALARPRSGMRIMTTSRRLASRKVEKFEKNITKRGFVPESTTKKGNNYPVGPILLGFFVFVVIGSCKFLHLPYNKMQKTMLYSTCIYVTPFFLFFPALFQIIRTATSGGMA
nr:stress-associated endoplasmic reticulum protein 2-like [Ipomoea batatas]